MALFRKEVLLSVFAIFSLAFAFQGENKLRENAITEREIPTMTVVSTNRFLSICGGLCSEPALADSFATRHM